MSNYVHIYGVSRALVVYCFWGVRIWRLWGAFSSDACSLGLPKNVSILPIVTTTITVLTVTGLRCFRAVFVNLREIFGNPQVYTILLGRLRLTFVVSFAELRAIYRLRALVLFPSAHARKVTVKLCKEKWMRSFSLKSRLLRPSMNSLATLNQSYQAKKKRKEKKILPLKKFNVTLFGWRSPQYSY